MDLASLAFDHPCLARELLKKVIGEQNLADGQEVRNTFVLRRVKAQKPVL